MTTDVGSVKFPILETGIQNVEETEREANPHRNEVVVLVIDRIPRIVAVYVPVRVHHPVVDQVPVVAVDLLRAPTVVVDDGEDEAHLRRVTEALDRHLQANGVVNSKDERSNVRSTCAKMITLRSCHCLYNSVGYVFP